MHPRAILILAAALVAASSVSALPSSHAGNSDNYPADDAYPMYAGAKSGGENNYKPPTPTKTPCETPTPTPTETPCSTSTTGYTAPTANPKGAFGSGDVKPSGQDRPVCPAPVTITKQVTQTLPAVTKTETKTLPPVTKTVTTTVVKPVVKVKTVEKPVTTTVKCTTTVHETEYVTKVQTKHQTKVVTQYATVTKTVGALPTGASKQPTDSAYGDVKPYTPPTPAPAAYGPVKSYDAGAAPANYDATPKYDTAPKYDDYEPAPYAMPTGDASDAYGYNSYE